MVMQHKDEKTDDAAGVGAEGGRRPTAAPAPAAAGPEMSDRPRRRTFTAQTKLRVLAEIDARPTSRHRRDPGAARVPYSSTLTDWRRQRDSGALGGLTSAKRGPKAAARNPLAAELAQAKRETARLGRHCSKPKRSSKSKKKLQPCWESHWRRQTTTTRHDGCSRRPGADVRPDRRRLRGCERVARQRLPPARRSGPSTGGASPQTRPAAGTFRRGTPTVLGLLRAPRFADQAPAEVYASLLDEGVYHCSIRTMYRILVANQEVRERRNQLRHPVYKKPELLAQAPNQVWSWDITD